MKGAELDDDIIFTDRVCEARKYPRQKKRPSSPSSRARLEKMFVSLQSGD